MGHLLTRDEFRTQVFERDKGRCVVCGEPAVDAHHILERRLFPDGGYYLDNGASVCGQCHINCEATVLSVEELRQHAKISRAVLPPQLDADGCYDKWGNPVLANGQRLRGELFQDENVQKILKVGGVLGLFTTWVKYPRTYHLPWSPGVGSDDRIIEDLSHFTGEEVVVTEKMDGECTTLYRDHWHARSVDSKSHPTRSWVANYWGGIAQDIPEGWRVCGENLYATHSIKYSDLRSYFLGFSLWDDRNFCRGWDETQEWFSLLGIESVPVLYRGRFDERRIKALSEDPRLKDRGHHEGYVVRLAAAFPASRFRHAVAKYVRADHVQTSGDWLNRGRFETNSTKQ